MITKQLTVTLAIASLCGLLTAPMASAAKMRMDGGFVTLGTDRALRSSQESGRYANLGKNYYRTANIGCTGIRNTSKSGISGQLSLEYWAVPFLGAESGTPLMSVLLSPIKAGKRIKNVKNEGPAGYYRANGYIQLRLYEFSGGSWKLRANRGIGALQPL